MERRRHLLENSRDLSDSGARERARRLLPSPKTFPCVDCGGQASEYDHYEGYGMNWNKVDPVCRSCHAKREFKRGTRGPRSRRVLVGPRMEKGYFFTSTYSKTMNRSISPRCRQNIL